MNKNTTYITWTIRIIVSFLFLLSAVAKMYPLWSFEKQLVDLGIASWCQSHYLARFILGLELAIGVAILLPHYLKRITIPGTILLLLLFCAHLTIEMVRHGMGGNCGCFGQLIPMTPMEALIKNIITIALLVYLWFKVSDREDGKNRFIYLWACFATAALLVFVLFPFEPCAKDKTEAIYTTTDSDTALPGDDTLTGEQSTMSEFKETLKVQTTIPIKIDSPKNGKVVSNTTEKTNVPSTPPATPATRSKFAGFTTFGNKKTNLDQGRKIVCMFAPGCDHCQATAKELGVMAKKGGFPETYILFMDEETDKIPEFFKIAEVNFPYIVLDIQKFWETIGSMASTPAVFYLENGKVIKMYQGIDNEKFNGDEFKRIVGK